MDYLKKVQPGDTLRFPAATFNTFIDAARDFRSRQQGSAQTARPRYHQSGIILVKNTSGADCDRFGILGVDGPIFTPTDNEEEFKNRVTLRGVLPAEADHTGKFVILAEPLADGAIGRAYADGVCPVKINVGNEAHAYADIEDAQTQYLKSGTSGAAQILWAELGTGVKWAIVRLGALTQATALFACLVWQDGGTTNGDADTACNRTYKARTLDATGPGTGGTVLGEYLGPKKRRWTIHFGQYICPPAAGPGVIGSGYYNYDNEFQLLDANETPFSTGYE